MPGKDGLSASLVFAGDAVPGQRIPIFTCKDGGVIFRPLQTRLVCGNGGDSGGGCGAFTCPRATYVPSNLGSFQFPGDGCNGGSWRPADFGMYLRRVALWHQINRRLGYNEIIVDANHWARQPGLTVETMFRIKGQAGEGAVREMHRAFLRGTGQSQSEAPLVVVDPSNWEAPFAADA